jgi:hypothetical protein
MTRLSSFAALPGALVKTLTFFRQNIGIAAAVAILPGLAAIALTWQTGTITNASTASNWPFYFLTLTLWAGAMILSQAAMFRLALRGRNGGIFGYQFGLDELRLAASWALIVFLLIIAGGIGLVVFAAIMATVSIVSLDDAGIAAENPVETGNIPDPFGYYGATEWGVAIVVGGVFAVLLAGFFGRLLLAPAATMARRKVQALSVMVMTKKRGFAVILGVLLCFIPAGLLIHGFGILAEQFFDAPVHQPARLLSEGVMLPGWAIYAPLAFVHGWLAAFLTSPLIAALTASLYRAWGGDD